MSTVARKIAFHTLGCKLNFSETSTLSRDSLKYGYENVNSKEFADIYVFNTCSVTENANKETRKLIRRSKRINPNAFITLVGCYAQLKPKELANIEDVNLVLGTEDKFELLNHLDQIDFSNYTKLSFGGPIKDVKAFKPSYSSDDRTRSFLKVQDGCDYICTFCTIPLARGKSRNASIKKTVNLAKDISIKNVKEIVLTGVNIGDFGVNSHEKFIDLLVALNDLNDLDRIRISSIEPNLLSNEIIEFCAKSKKIMPHFHIPLQSGSSRILKLMRRKYQTSLYKERIEHIKSLIPDACIGADIIIGFPSETDDDFLKSYDFIESLNISYLHVFSYSERQNTKAIKIKNKVSKTKKAERSLAMRELSKELKLSFEKSFVGSTREVLFEYQIDNQWFGHSDNYLPVRVNTEENLKNSIENVNIVNSVKNYLVGSFLN